MSTPYVDVTSVTPLTFASRACADFGARQFTTLMASNISVTSNPAAASRLAIAPASLPGFSVTVRSNVSVLQTHLELIASVSQDRVHAINPCTPCLKN